MTIPARFDRSATAWAAATRVTPNGAQTSSKAPGAVGPVGAFPLYLREGRGAHVTDVDGNTFIDWFNGNCSVILGHANTDVAASVYRALQTGPMLSLPSVDEAAVAARLIALIPCAEQVRFVKTGSEACAGAVRIARMATGRDVIVCVSGQYHGWHDWHCVTKPKHPGVPEFMGQGVRTFRYNDLASLEAELGADVAAVMLEPTLTEAPAEGFLEGVVARAHAAGALVIFDEMITGARWHVGGAQAYYGVTPDLATFGKAYGNGVPLAFIAGRADLMTHAWTVSGTFGGDRLGLAACDAVLTALAQTDAVGIMWTAGRCLMAAVNNRASAAGWPMHLAGPAVRPVWDWQLHGDYYRPAPYAMFTNFKSVGVALLQQELARRGMLVHPSGWNTSVCHTGDVLAASIEAVLQAGDQVAAWIREADPSCHLHGQLLTGGLVRQAVRA